MSCLDRFQKAPRAVLHVVTQKFLWALLAPLLISAKSIAAPYCLTEARMPRDVLTLWSSQVKKLRADSGDRVLVRLRGEGDFGSEITLSRLIRVAEDLERHLEKERYPMNQIRFFFELGDSPSASKDVSALVNQCHGLVITLALRTNSN